MFETEGIWLDDFSLKGNQSCGAVKRMGKLTENPAPSPRLHVQGRSEASLSGLAHWQSKVATLGTELGERMVEHSGSTLHRGGFCAEGRSSQRAIFIRFEHREW